MRSPPVAVSASISASAARARCCARWRSPELGLRGVLIGGTNGKGSTGA